MNRLFTYYKNFHNMRKKKLYFHIIKYKFQIKYMVIIINLKILNDKEKCGIKKEISFK